MKFDCLFDATIQNSNETLGIHFTAKFIYAFDKSQLSMISYAMAK